MKDQYFGDVNDYRKFGLLRGLTSERDLRLSICWALTRSDGRTDGSKTQYLENPSIWRRFDPELFAFLRQQVVDRGDRRVGAIEGTRVLGDCNFFSETLPREEAARDGYFERLCDLAARTDLVFFDPDNGLGVKSTPRGCPNSEKYVYPSELASVFSLGPSILLYQHFPRRPRTQFTQWLARSLCELLGSERAVAFITPHVLFLLVPNRRHWAALRAGAERVAGRWSGQIGVVHLSRLGNLRPVPFDAFGPREAAPVAA